MSANTPGMANPAALSTDPHVRAAQLDYAAKQARRQVKTNLAATATVVALEADNDRRRQALAASDGARRAELANQLEADISRAITNRIFRSPVNTTTSDVEGLAGTFGGAGSWIEAALARRTAPLQAFVDAVTTATLRPGTGRPWIPELPPPLAGAPAPATEKTELVSVKVIVSGDEQIPTLIAAVTNVSAQAYGAAGDTIELLLREATLVATVGYVAAALEAAAGTPVTDLAAAITNLEAGGWPPSLIAGPTSQLLGLDLRQIELAGIAVVPAPTSSLLVVSLPGCWIATTDTAVRRTEPRIGGYEIGAYTDAVAQVQDGAVAQITGGT